MDPTMVDPGFPDSHTTTTTTTTRVQTNLRFDPSYIKTIPGILKCVQIGLNLLGYICVMLSGMSYHPTSNWFAFVSMLGFWMTGILLVFYLMHVIERFYMVPWLMIEFGYTALCSFFYLTAASACAVWGDQVPAWAAAAFFGYAAMIAYGVDAFFKFKGWRGGDIAQGDRSVQMGGGMSDMQSPGGAY